MLSLLAMASGEPPAAWAQAEGLQLDRQPLGQAIGKPPAQGSPAANNDLAILLWLQKTRTPEMEANTWLTLERNPSVFSRTLGVDMARNTPRLNAGLISFLVPIDAVKDSFKKELARRRPFVQFPQIKPCLPLEGTNSYPSGHATWFRATAELLADLFPKRQSEIVALGALGGSNRVLCGVHFPSDVEAGQRFGVAAARQIINSAQWRSFKANPEIQAELQKISPISGQTRR
ncbi:phosphatase PAP2 family protein [Cyanobium sp. HWJ4-Hawea]|uniref:phosphatase PAP2 family protein n=1 Tax=Cyanobium sp. HWJ4-Hawea TaxID=2823713 RepID=UPI0020CECBC9|nr:phosphatase PAP2 family protein [Cyanobium sp. HWJ4-Hawea]